MYTGIVAGTATVTDREDHADYRTLTLSLPEGTREHLAVGASVAGNGCCLTVRRILDAEAGSITVDMMGETLSRTNLGELQTGDRVNIERSMVVGAEIGGHQMSGHILTTAAIIDMEDHGATRSLTIELPAAAKPYILEKGFVGLDGCSLTVGEVGQDYFRIHLIPETLERTCYGQRQVGDRLNLEVDAQTQAIVDTVERVLAQRG